MTKALSLFVVIGLLVGLGSPAHAGGCQYGQNCGGSYGGRHDDRGRSRPRGPTPEQAYRSAPHEQTYECVRCAPGYSQAPDCACSLTTWHPGPPPGYND